MVSLLESYSKGPWIESWLRYACTQSGLASFLCYTGYFIKKYNNNKKKEQSEKNRRKKRQNNKPKQKERKDGQKRKKQQNEGKTTKKNVTRIIHEIYFA